MLTLESRQYVTRKAPDTPYIWNVPSTANTMQCKTIWRIFYTFTPITIGEYSVLYDRMSRLMSQGHDFDF